MAAIGPEAIVQALGSHAGAQLEGDTVVLSLRTGRYFGMDEVGSRIWSLVQQPRRVSDIRALLTQEFAVNPQRCELDLLYFLNELQQAGLIEVVAS